jgi:hypothetical protein
VSNPSPACTVNSSSPPVDVSASSTPTIALASAVGANYWFLQAVYADDTTSVATINSSLSINQTNKTATFTAPSASPTAVIFMSTVGVAPGSAIGAGLDANFTLQPSFTTTFKVNVPASGLRVVCTDETFEQNASAGWVQELNAIVRALVPYVKAAGNASFDFNSLTGGNTTALHSFVYFSSLTGSQTLKFPASPFVGQQITASVDSSCSSSNTIVVNPDGNSFVYQTSGGLTTSTSSQTAMAHGYESATWEWNGSLWSLVSWVYASGAP